MGERIDVILHAARGGKENMTRDVEALARAERGEASLRIYRWDRPVVTLGRSQQPEDVAEIFPGLPTIKRPTGGGAVLHGSDLTLALAVPLEMLRVEPREVKATYRKLVALVRESLNICGVPSRLAEESATPSHPDCFSGPGRMDLISKSNSVKIAGCAMAATRSAALLHVSIPISPPPAELGLSAETREHYTMRPWPYRHFSIAAFIFLLNAVHAAGWVSGVEPRLAELDPNLNALERAAAVLHLIYDARDIQDSPFHPRAYDELAEIFATRPLDEIVSTLGVPKSPFFTRAHIEHLLRLMRGFKSDDTIERLHSRQLIWRERESS